MELYGLIGNPVSGSLSPKIQNSVLKNLGGVYLAFNVNKEDLGAAIRGLRVLSKGFNITVPYKEESLKMLDRIEGFATNIQAVNTVAVDGKALVGYNTDVGALFALLGKITVSNAVIYGAGGAARAAALALSKIGCNEFYIINRSRARAAALGDLIKSWGASAKFGQCQNADVFVNATPMGMYADDDELIEAYQKGNYKLTIDLAYRENGTKLQRLSKQAIGGLDILIEQAAQSIKIWKGIEPDRDVMKKAVTDDVK